MKSTGVMSAIFTMTICGGMFLDCNENRAYGDSRVNRTWLDVKSLEQAVTAYWLRMGEWPSSLELLTERLPDGSPAFLEDASVLFDSWGQRYHYDPKQLSPESGKPLIWSDGRPGDSNGKIANWGEGSTFKLPNDVPWIAIAVLIGIAVVVIVIGWDVFQRAKGRPSPINNTIGIAGFLLAVFAVAGAFYFYIVYTTMLD